MSLRYNPQTCQLDDIGNDLHLTGGTLTGDLAIGTESSGHNLTINGTLGAEAFTDFTVATNWTLTSGWEATNDGGTQLNHNGAGTTSATFLKNAPTANTVYKVTFTMNASVTGGTRVYYGSSADSNVFNPAISTPTTYIFYVTAAGSGNLLISPVTTGARFIITAISIKPITAGTGVSTNYGNFALAGKLINPYSNAGGLYIENSGITRIVSSMLIGTIGTGITPGGIISSIKSSMGTASGDGLYVAAYNAATVGTPVEMSPRLNFKGYVWDTGTSSSKYVSFKNEVLPISGNPGSGRLLWGYDYNGGGYTELMGLTSEGYLGIGTSTPTSQLDIYKNIVNQTPMITLRGDNYLGAIRFYREDSRTSYPDSYSEIRGLYGSGDARRTILTFLTSDAGNATERMRISASGSVGIGTTAPTAILHIKAGTATAATAPLKFTSGTLMTNPEVGAIEFDGSRLYITI